MKKNIEDNRYTFINRSIDQASRSSNPFPLQSLPPEAWKCLCVVAWKRLERSNPRWAELIEDEFDNFKSTYVFHGYMHKKEYRGNKTILARYGGNVGWAWLVEAFQFMLNTSPPKKGQRPLTDGRNIEAGYKHIVLAVKALKKEFASIKTKPVKEQRGWWQEQLQSILNQRPYYDDTGEADNPDDRWKRAIVTRKMIDLAVTGPASEVAYAILYHRYNLSPSTLKQKLFPRVRKSPLSPIELWRDKLRTPPHL